MSRSASKFSPWALALVASVLLSSCGSGDSGGAMAGMDHGGGTGTTQPAQSASAATCSSQGTSLGLSAASSKFDVACLAVPTGQAFAITFDNREPVAHNVTILPGHSTPEPLFRGELIQGPKTVTYQVPALSAGTYVFHCETHPDTMRGTLIVA